MSQRNQFLAGFAGGLLAPLLGFYLYYISFFRQMDIIAFLCTAKQQYPCCCHQPESAGKPCTVFYTDAMEN